MALINKKTGRDLELFKAGFAEWLQHGYSEGGPCEISHIATFQENGLSNEMLFVEVVWSPNDESREQLVIRLPPPPESMLFPEYDLEKQALIQTQLSEHGVPTAVPLAYEADPKWVGSCFLVMPKIEGRSPPDQPGYAHAGWVKELGPDRRRHVFDGFLTSLAKIHRLDIDRTGFRAIAARAESGASALRTEWLWWGRYLDWLAVDGRTDALAEVRATLEWCQAHWPRHEPAPSLLWGDPRPGNVLYGEDQSVVALLDFENATLGPAEVDYGWWMASRLYRYARDGGSLPELDGLPDRTESLQIFESHLERSLHHVAWHEIFGAARIGASICGIKAMLKRRKLPDFPLGAIEPWVREAMANYTQDDDL